MTYRRTNEMKCNTLQNFLQSVHEYGAAPWKERILCCTSYCMIAVRSLLKYYNSWAQGWEILLGMEVPFLRLLYSTMRNISLPITYKIGRNGSSGSFQLLQNALLHSFLCKIWYKTNIWPDVIRDQLMSNLSQNTVRPNHSTWIWKIGVQLFSGKTGHQFFWSHIMSSGSTVSCFKCKLLV